MSSNPTPAPGWYPDPSGSGARWWDGGQWTAHTAPAPQANPPTPAGPAGGWGPGASAGGGAGTGWGGGAGGGTWGGAGPWGGGAGMPQMFDAPPSQPATAWQRNRYSFITFIIVSVYVLLALFVHIWFFGIVPIAMSARAIQSKEPLGPVALGAAILGIAAGVTLIVTR